MQLSLVITERGGEMVQCCNSYCENGWYHVDCLTAQQQGTIANTLWYCSVACQASSGFIYCDCRQKKGQADDNLVQCQLKDNCRRHEYYHEKCVGLLAGNVPGDYQNYDDFISFLDVSKFIYYDNYRGMVLLGGMSAWRGG